MLSPAPAQAWGFAGHRMVARKALGTLPDPLRKAFGANADYLVEQSINPDLQRFMARRMGATTIEVDASHVSLISRPQEITDLIVQAAARG